jgi:hypothetical protein
LPTTIRILHISDLHERVALDWMSAERKAQVRLGMAERHRVLEEDFSKKLVSIRPIDIVCFTGDVADWGLEEEYKLATVRFKSILRQLGLPSDRLFVVPGNHDVKRPKKEDGDYEEAQKIFDSFRSLARKHPKEVSNWFGGMKPPFGAERKWCDDILRRTRTFRDWLANDLGRSDLMPEKHPHQKLGYRVTLTLANVAVHVIGLDSAWMCGDDNDPKKILLTQGQIDMATRDAPGKQLDGFRLALVHHPLEELFDGDQSSQRLAETVGLLLHGRQHTPKAQEKFDPDRSLRVLAAGSLYEGDEGDLYPNSFNVIEVNLNDEGRPLKYNLEFWGWSPNGHWYRTGAIYRAAPEGRMTWLTPLGQKDRPAMLPVIATPFIGRRVEVDEHLNLVLAHRLVTLTGTGGIGKTRLANEIVRRLRDERHEFTDGIFFVDLEHSSENSDQGVVSAIASALGEQVKADDEAQVIAAFGEHRALLVLDNFETSINGASVVARLLQGCPDLHLLVTSRARLRVVGEQWRPVSAMDVPKETGALTVDKLAKFDSFELFRERAQAAQPNWNVTDSTAPIVGQILEMTDGIPLVIAMIASRINEGTVAEIANGLKERPELQHRERAGANERQASIAAFEWSLNLLPAAAQELFPKLAVFAGGFFADDV